MQSRNLRTLVSLCLTFILAGVVAFAGPPAQSELSFSAEMFDPKKGDTVWSATAEWLIPVAGGPLLVGPSVSKFDAGWLDGGAAGIAAEINLGKVCGPGIGGAAHKPIGDSGDQVNLTYEARLFFKCGTEHAFVKFTASQLWSRAEAGAVTDPDGTSFDGGIGWRF
jgi:hypothetical protein